MVEGKYCICQEEKFALESMFFGSFLRQKETLPLSRQQKAEAGNLATETNHKRTCIGKNRLNKGECFYQPQAGACSCMEQ